MLLQGGNGRWRGQNGVVGRWEWFKAGDVVGTRAWRERDRCEDGIGPFGMLKGCWCLELACCELAIEVSVVRLELVWVVRRTWGESVSVAVVMPTDCYGDGWGWGQGWERFQFL